MKKIFMAGLLAAAVGGVAAAQNAPQMPSNNSGSQNNADARSSATLTGGTMKSTGIAKPPPGTAAPSPKRIDPINGPQLGNNTPTLPQIARHPMATIGSPTPIAGAGGTSKYPVGTSN